MVASSERQLLLPPLSNADVADCLDEVAELLEQQGANPFRVRAYRNGADSLRTLKRPVWEIVESEGRETLLGIPAVGKSLARAVEQLACTGRLPLLQRLRGDHEPQRVFTTVADVGPRLARRIHEHLGIETLAELEAAACDGRLSRVPGMGQKRVRAVRESLAGRFRRPAPPQPETALSPESAEQPPVEELLGIDRRYRELATVGRLPRIAPRRFNPTGQAWLPILHTQRGDRHYTALYSNTARAHEMGTTHDWVVIYRDDDDGHGRWTLITSRFGRLRGRRIVRGREAECARFYEQLPGGESTNSAGVASKGAG